MPVNDFSFLIEDDDEIGMGKLSVADFAVFEPEEDGAGK